MTDLRPIGYWLKLVDQLINEQFATTLEEHGVTRRQWQLLGTLSRGPASVDQLTREVAPFLDTEGETVVEHLAELVESGWVTVSEAGYAITDRGRIAYQRLAEVVSVNRDAATHDVSPADYATTLATLERVARNLGWTGDPEASATGAPDPA